MPFFYKFMFIYKELIPPICKFFEMHNGTYTSQAATKAGNRYSEILLHDVEFLAAFAGAVGNSLHYPHAELDRLWKNLLL